ncbi:MAG: chemotaxis protein CheB [Ginsengibacter sp.]
MKQIEKNSTPEVSKNLFPVVGIGASAGGLEAFKKLIKTIPLNSGMAYILVQHLHPEYESALPEILQRETKIPVVEIIDKVHVEPDFIYVIPANKLLTASDGILKLDPRPEKNKNSLPIDIFFSSLAEVHGSQSIGVILSGTGSDGTVGLEDIKNQGGLTIAQDAETAGYNAMPQNAIDAGIVDFILPPEKIVEKLIELHRTYESYYNNGKKSVDDKLIEDGFRRVLAMLRMRKGVDFNFYKQTTIRRRIVRRMMILKLTTIPDYQQYLKNNMYELDLLFQDLLIQVTSFFRDTEAFNVLCSTILPEIVKNKSNDNILRIWVPGCASGQEAYSIAICLSEFLSSYPEAIKVKIFGTDISEKSIAKARSGIYSKTEIESVSDSRLTQFFKKTDNHYQLTKQIRDLCIFAVHDFLKDPPFAKMNLISCRNVLIYFEPFLQKKALTLFHYALIDKGFLMLGKSESVGNLSDLFSVFDTNKFFTRKPTPGRFMNVISGHTESSFANKNYFVSHHEEKTDDYQKSADEILLSKYTPVGVVVNEQFDIVQFRGSTGTYLEASPGKASLNILKMAREGLGFEIRNALQKAKITGEPFVKYGLPIQKGKKNISIEVIPLLDTIDLHYLILFRDEPTDMGADHEYDVNGNLAKIQEQTAKNKKDRKDTRIEQLEKELAQARKDMLRITEEQEASNEELQSSNEELLSGSEELQSLNEELETSKEELQSTNEELITINQELYDRIDQLNHARRFSDTIISILHEPLLVLDRKFYIKRANEAFYKSFKLTEEKALGNVLFELQDNTWTITELLIGLKRIKERKEVMIELEIEHTFPVIGTRIILFNIQMIEKGDSESLILLALNDITEIKNAEKLRSMAVSMERNAEMLNNLYMNSPAFVCTYKEPNHIYDLVNPAYQQIIGKRQIVGKPLLEALPELEGQGFHKLLDKVYETGEIYVAKEQLAWVAYDEGLPPSERYFNFSYQPMYDENKNIIGILCFGYEVTMEVLAKKKGEANLRLILETIPQITFTASSEGKLLFFNKFALDYSGLTIEEATTGKGWAKIIHPEELESIIVLAEACLRNGEDFYKEIRLKKNSDGNYRWHLMQATHIKDETEGGITAWVGMATDIQEQKIKEQKKDEFMNIASHEMKTPLAATKGYLQLLEMSLDAASEPALFVSKALHSVNRLNNLVNELLEVGKTQNGQLNYNISVFDFNKMVAATIDDQHNSSPEYIIIKKGELSSKIKGDSDRLQQVVVNLVNNAIKYSPNEKKIIVTIKEKEDELIFSVKDRGIGISKDNLENVFKRYFRVEDQAMRFQGMGIGLFISNEIIKRHNGKMWVESELGKGSTFYFAIPVAAQ